MIEQFLSSSNELINLQFMCYDLEDPEHDNSNVYSQLSQYTQILEVWCKHCLCTQIRKI